MTHKIKLAIVDDHDLFRKGMIALLSSYNEFEITIEASNGKELIEKLRAKKADVVLLDLQMPQMDGVETTEYLQIKYPDIKIIVVTMHNEDGFIQHLIRKGANGFLLKNQEIEEVVAAIHSVVNTNYYFNDFVSKALVTALISGNNIKPTFNNTINFSDKELEIIKLISREKTNKEIAELLTLSTRTIENYREKILAKTNAKNSIGIVMYAVKHKLI